MSFVFLNHICRPHILHSCIQNTSSLMIMFLPSESFKSVLMVFFSLRVKNKPKIEGGAGMKYWREYVDIQT